MEKLVFGDEQSIKVRDNAALAQKLDEMNDSLTTGPWRADIEKNTGKNWLLAKLGCSQYDDQTYIITTNQVHASEFSGDAKDDAELIAELRNLLPVIIRALRP